MRLVVIAVVVIAATRVGSTDVRPAKPPAQPINLAHTYGTWIGVSSQINSAEMTLQDLVDSDPTTAWNSASGDLVGAWIDVHVAPTVQIASIMMTVGFTKVDAERGDLFTANTRIKKVRVTHDGKLIYDKVLDVNNRAVQELPINATGGTVRIEVLEVIRGTNPAWNQTCVSDLVVLGTPADDVQRALPVVVGTTAPPLPSIRLSDVGPCTATFDSDIVTRQLPASLVAIDATRLEGDWLACHVEAASTETSPEHTHLVFLVEGEKPKAPIGKLLTFTTQHQIVPAARKTDSVVLVGATSSSKAVTTIGGDVELRAVPLAPHEIALLVDHTRRLDGGGLADGTTVSTIYRATKTGLVEVLRFESKWTSKSNVSDICEVAIGLKREPFADLDVGCKKTEKQVDPKIGDVVTERVEHFRWNGSKYAKR